MEPLCLDWLERVVRGFVCTYARTMGGVMAEDFHVTAHVQQDGRIGVIMTAEDGAYAKGLCRTRDHFRALASVVGLPLREQQEPPA